MLNTVLPTSSGSRCTTARPRSWRGTVPPGFSRSTWDEAFGPLETRDVPAISLVHHRACLIAYRFINWRYPLDEVERWYSGKFIEWTWTLAALGADATMAGFIALIDRHVDQLYVDPSHQRCGIGSALLDRAIESSPGRIMLHVFEENAPARAFY